MQVQPGFTNTAITVLLLRVAYEMPLVPFARLLCQFWSFVFLIEPDSTVCLQLQLGFTNTTAPCLGGSSFLEDLIGGYISPICSSPNSYVFWDPVHLTKHTHALLAQDFMANLPQLNQNTA